MDEIKLLLDKINSPLLTIPGIGPITGATILGEVVGYGFSSNGDHISVPNVEGPAKSLEMALKDAMLNASQIDYINAHATATPVGDLNEATLSGNWK